MNIPDINQVQIGVDLIQIISISFFNHKRNKKNYNLEKIESYLKIDKNNHRITHEIKKSLLQMCHEIIELKPPFFSKWYRKSSIALNTNFGVVINEVDELQRYLRQYENENFNENDLQIKAHSEIVKNSATSSIASISRVKYSRKSKIEFICKLNENFDDLIQEINDAKKYIITLSREYSKENNEKGENYE